MNETAIKNCPWGYSCKKQWDDLVNTPDNNVRFCTACQKDVYWVNDKDELAKSVKLNRCVSFKLALLVRDGNAVENQTRLFVGQMGSEYMADPGDDHNGN